MPHFSVLAGSWEDCFRADIFTIGKYFPCKIYFVFHKQFEHGESTLMRRKLTRRSGGNMIYVVSDFVRRPRIRLL